MSDLFLVLPGAVAAGASAAGAKRVDRRVAFGVALAAGAALALVTAGERAAGVHEGALIAGVAIAAVFVAILPLIAYYELGRAMLGHRVVLAVLWLLSLVPLYFYLFFAWLAVAAKVSCPPGAYECPV